MQQPQIRVAALIGDLVASRAAPDRLDLQRRVGSVFAEIDEVVGGQPAFTIGDEFQARYATVVEAVEASLQLHLRTIGVTSMRIGIGWGELIAEDPERTPFAQDGPCWWRAREAIEAVDRSGRGRGPELHTAIRTETTLDPLLNSYLLLRDTLIQGLDEMDARIALGLLSGRRQTEMADALGVNKSSVSKRANTHGILALIEARSIGLLPLPEER
ncbi:MAG: SatD family protein [Acidimicrobiia bacterium]